MASIIAKKKGNKLYYYLVESARVNGKPRIVSQKYLGTTDRIREMAMGHRVKPEQFSVLEFGSTAAIYSILKDLGIRDSINMHVKRNGKLTVGDYILIAAINRTVMPVSHRKLQEWYSHSFMKIIYPSSWNMLSGQNYWNNTHEIGKEEIDEMQKEIMHSVMKVVDMKELFFDTTNFPTFIDQYSYDGNIVRKTHSKAHREDLMHVALWLLVDSTGLPLLHGTYEANKSDVEVFGEFLKYANNYREFLKSVESITLIFDKGNNNMDNISNIKYHYIGALRPSTEKELLKIPVSEYKEMKNGTKYYRTRGKVYGKDHVIVITYNQALANKKERSFASKVEKCKFFIKEYVEKANRSKRKRRIETIRKGINRYLKEKKMNKYIEYRIEYDKVYRAEIKEKKEEIDYMYGKNIIFTDREEMETEEIITRYRDRWIIEDGFKKMNYEDNISVTPIYTWTDQQITLHIFVCIIALLGMRMLRKRLKEAGIEMSVERALEILREVHAIGALYENRKIEWKIEEMEKEAEMLVDALKLKPLFNEMVGNSG